MAIVVGLGSAVNWTQDIDTAVISSLCWVHRPSCCAEILRYAYESDVTQNIKFSKQIVNIVN